ncbi:hypothetical protein Desru_2070 [Desulforamulus ruminis DSM 2154]|uniref:Uncharacterized protein n=1 Tax=Desulforamulus ruminis (strain ATCC 23193 / DSM 2154 / NCIMB 8452 / DL) TaxID=696281 RepID=F6DK08_DESRL|nr:hypothetical protein Desru_2070 [Desulforamulus ruminis DSM 2154]
MNHDNRKPERLYYWCKEDIFVEITEEMLEAMKTADRQESACKRRTYRYKAHYILDMGDGIDNECLTKPETPEEIYIGEETEAIILTAIGELTEVQPDCENGGTDRRKYQQFGEVCAEAV